MRGEECPLISRSCSKNGQSARLDLEVFLITFSEKIYIEAYIQSVIRLLLKQAEQDRRG